MAGMKIALACDHAGFTLKEALLRHVQALGHEVLDLGAHSLDSVHYPEYGYALGQAVASGQAQRGIAICGSGIGIAIAANRLPQIRCAQVSEPLSASLARSHNDANMIALGARLMGEDMAKACVTAFLETAFLGGRHSLRVDMLASPPQNEGR